MNFSRHSRPLPPDTPSPSPALQRLSAVLLGLAGLIAVVAIAFLLFLHTRRDAPSRASAVVISAGAPTPAADALAIAPSGARPPSPQPTAVPAQAVPSQPGTGPSQDVVVPSLVGRGAAADTVPAAAAVPVPSPALPAQVASPGTAAATPSPPDTRSTESLPPNPPPPRAALQPDSPVGPLRPTPGSLSAVVNAHAWSEPDHLAGVASRHTRCHDGHCVPAASATGPGPNQAAGVGRRQVPRHHQIAAGWQRRRRPPRRCRRYT